MRKRRLFVFRSSRRPPAAGVNIKRSVENSPIVCKVIIASLRFHPAAAEKLRLELRFRFKPE